MSDRASASFGWAASGPCATESLSSAATHLVECAEVWRKPAVHAEDPPVDDRRKCEVVKDVGTVSPRVGVAVFPLALIEEAIHLQRCSCERAGSSESPLQRSRRKASRRACNGEQQTALGKRKESDEQPSEPPPDTSVQGRTVFLQHAVLRHAASGACEPE